MYLTQSLCGILRTILLETYDACEPLGSANSFYNVSSQRKIISVHVTKS